MEDELNFDRIEASIGRLILACSRVEYEMLRLYEAWLPSRNYFADRYHKRFEYAGDAVRKRLADPDAILGMLARMKELSSTRHLVAHNPIHHVTQDARAKHNIEAEFAIFDNKGGQTAMSVAELENRAQQAFFLSVKLSVALRTSVPHGS